MTVADETARRVEAPLPEKTLVLSENVAEQGDSASSERINKRTLDISQQKQYSFSPAESTERPPSASRNFLQHRLDYIWNGERCFVPQNTAFSEVTSIAGYGTEKPIQDIDRLVNTYHHPSAEWRKQVGRVDSGKYVFDLHWYEAKDGIQREMKLKNRKERKT